MVGTVREVATRTLRQLEETGSIRLERRSASILDRHAARTPQRGAVARSVVTPVSLVLTRASPSLR